MDFTDEYKNMCIQAQEIQELWMPSLGDFYWDGKYQSFDVMTFPYEKPYDEEYGHWWIPRQDQLQEMLTEECLTKGGNLWHVYITFEEFVKAEYEKRSFFKTGQIISDSFEILWLKCVMKDKYDKIWDEEKWIIDTCDDVA